MQSSDSSSPSAVAPVVPCERPTTWWTLLLRPATGAPRPAPSWRLVTGPPPVLPGGGTRPPRFLGRPLARVPRFPTPPLALLSRPSRQKRYCLRGAQPSRLGEHQSFGANSRGPLARAPTHRRIPRGSGARLATGLPGSALAGRDSHPLDDIQDFRSSATPSLLTSLTWSHPCRSCSARGRSSPGFRGFIRSTACDMPQ